MSNHHNWRLLPFIVVMGLLVGWAGGQVIRLFTPADIVLPQRPKPSPR